MKIGIIFGIKLPTLFFQKSIHPWMSSIKGHKNVEFLITTHLSAVNLLQKKQIKQVCVMSLLIHY